MQSSLSLEGQGDCAGAPRQQAQCSRLVRVCACSCALLLQWCETGCRPCPSTAKRKRLSTPDQVRALPLTPRAADPTGLARRAERRESVRVCPRHAEPPRWPGRTAPPGMWAPCSACPRRWRARCRLRGWAGRRQVGRRQVGGWTAPTRRCGPRCRPTPLPTRAAGPHPAALSGLGPGAALPVSSPPGPPRMARPTASRPASRGGSCAEQADRGGVGVGVGSLGGPHPGGTARCAPGRVHARGRPAAPAALPAGSPAARRRRSPASNPRRLLGGDGGHPYLAAIRLLPGRYPRPQGAPQHRAPRFPGPNGARASRRSTRPGGA